MEANFRIDRQLSANHTLTIRYGLNRDANDNQGVGGFSLPSRGYNVRDNEDTWQLAETGVLNIHTINETRFRYRRQRTTETGATAGATVNVQDSFIGGGPPLALTFNNQDRYELQNSTSIVHGAATTARFGGLLRAVSLTNQDTGNYPGTFTFTSINSYQATEQGLQSGLTPAQIRAAGGGASQFSITAGNPLASLKQFDVGFLRRTIGRSSPISR